MATKEYPYIDPLYKLRYGFDWEIRSVAYRASLGGECTLCQARAAHAHHTNYKNIGREIAGLDVFPLCERHHKEAHLKGRWIFCRVDPLWGNHNTEAYSRMLQDKYLRKLLTLLVEA